MITENSDIYDRLPLAYRGRFKIFNVYSNGLNWIAIEPKIDIGLLLLRSSLKMIEKESRLNCALYLDKTSFYIKDKLIEEGIPFIIEDKQIFLPFLGYLLSVSRGRDLTPIHLISFITQKMLLTAIYEHWKSFKVSDVADRLDISRMSASRCFDELEYLNIDALDMVGRSRVITIPEDIKGFWEQIKDKLRDPVIKRFELVKDLKLEKKAGISALCEYSMLSDSAYPTYAVTKKEIKESGVYTTRQAGKFDDIGCVVLELGYFINFDGNKNQDPISIFLSTSKKELEDERVSLSLNNMLEDHVWSKV